MLKDISMTLESLEINRKNHTDQVVENIKEILTTLGEKEGSNIYNTVIEAGMLHDIGYAIKLNKYNFHPVDGYLYLREFGINESVLKLVLNHTYSELLYNMNGDIKVGLLDSIYYLNGYDKLSDVESYMLDILTLGDLMSDGKGNKVSIEDRITDIGDRHGYSSVVYQHIIKVKNLLLNNETIRNYLAVC